LPTGGIDAARRLIESAASPDNVPALRAHAMVLGRADLVAKLNRHQTSYEGNANPSHTIEELTAYLDAAGKMRRLKIRYQEYAELIDRAAELRVEPRVIDLCCKQLTNAASRGNDLARTLLSELGDVVPVAS
jgi:hypothetical protein